MSKSIQKKIRATFQYNGEKLFLLLITTPQNPSHVGREYLCLFKMESKKIKAEYRRAKVQLAQNSGELFMCLGNNNLSYKKSEYLDVFFFFYFRMESRELNWKRKNG